VQVVYLTHRRQVTLPGTLNELIFVLWSHDRFPVPAEPCTYYTVHPCKSIRPQTKFLLVYSVDYMNSNRMQRTSCYTLPEHGMPAAFLTVFRLDSYRAAVSFGRDFRYYK
jgi:hypothetical protein